MRKTTTIFFIIAKSVTFILFLFLIALIIISYSLKNEARINSYCVNKYQNEVIKINDENIKDYSYKYDCNTLYLEITLIDDGNTKLTKTLDSIKQQTNKYDCFIHITIICNDNTYYATISKQNKEIHFLGEI